MNNYYVYYEGTRIDTVRAYGYRINDRGVLIFTNSKADMISAYKDWIKVVRSS